MRIVSVSGERKRQPKVRGTEGSLECRVTVHRAENSMAILHRGRVLVDVLRCHLTSLFKLTCTLIILVLIGYDELMRIYIEKGLTIARDLLRSLN
jgi:hypothetical protein